MNGSRKAPREIRGADALGLAALFLGALLLRCWGIRFGLPAALHPDELTLVGWAAMLLWSGTLRAPRFDWPSLPAYLAYLAFAAVYIVGRATGRLHDFDQIIEAWRSDRTVFYLTARALSAVTGALTVIPVWLLASRLYGVRAARVASAVMAVMPLAVLHSHYAVPDTELVLWTACALAAAAAMLGDPATSRYASAGFAVGLAVATKYNGFLLGLPIVVAHWLRGCARGGVERAHVGLPGVVKLLLAGGAAVTTFFVTNPSAWIDRSRFVADLRWQAQHMSGGHAGIVVSPWEHLWLFHAQHSLVPGLTWAGALAALAAVALLAARRRPADWLLLSWIVPFYLMMENARGKPAPDYARSILPLFPALAVALGAAFDAMLEARDGLAPPMRRWARVAIGAAAVALVGWLTLDSAMLSATLDPDTRTVARAWVVRFWSGVVRDGEPVYVKDAGGYTPIVPGGVDYPEDPAWLAAHPGVYVTSSFRWQRYEDDADPQAERAFYRELFLHGDRIAEFQPSWRSLGHSNPIIRVTRYP